MNPDEAALLTDLYQLTMMQGYWAHGRTDDWASFDLFFRKVPEGGGYCVAAGIDDALAYVAAARFTAPQREYLSSLGMFRPAFLDYLHSLRFTGTIRAMDEGTLVFPHEPMLEVTAPLIEAQWIESLLLNCINFQTLIATKASRIVRTARPATVIEFGLRRAQGPNGARWGSKAAYLGGCIGTSNLDAGFHYRIPVFGTHAHSWVMSFPSEADAFRAYGEVYPDQSVLLIDTYDTLRQGLPRAIAEAQRLRDTGHQLLGVRLDSGNLAELAKACRSAFDAAGLDFVKIVASSDIDEYVIEELNAQQAPIDIYGVGTRLATAFGEPALGGVYKLTAVRTQGGWSPRIKIADDAAKMTIPGRKQVWRLEAADRYIRDVLAGADEEAPRRFRPIHGSAVPTPLEAGALRPLMRPRIEAGVLRPDQRSLDEMRADVAAELDRLPSEHRRLHRPDPYPVDLSEELWSFRDERIGRAKSPPTD